MSGIKCLTNNDLLTIYIILSNIVNLFEKHKFDFKRNKVKTNYDFYYSLTHCHVIFTSSSVNKT